MWKRKLRNKVEGMADYLLQNGRLHIFSNHNIRVFQGMYVVPGKEGVQICNPVDKPHIRDNWTMTMPELFAPIEGIVRSTIKLFQAWDVLIYHPDPFC